MRPGATALAALTLTLAAACQGGGGGRSHPGGPLIVVSAPLTAEPWVGRSIERGARLAVEQANASRGSRPAMRLEVLDNASSPTRALANARRAVSEGAAALITDGTGALSVAGVSDPVSLPVFVVYDGGASFIDAHAHPTMFRMAPANRPMSTRLVDYLSSRAHKVALLSDDSSYGMDGATPIRQALAHNGIRVTSDQVLPSGGSDVSPQLLRARSNGADTVIVWAGARTVGAVIKTARGTGWQVPIYTGPPGEDPLVRQLLADHPTWLDGTTFVSFRITSEQGPAPFASFRAQFEHRYGPDQVGVSADGTPVIQPPDWATYPYDTVHLVAAALDKAGGRVGAPLIAALENTVIAGANGDERGYGPDDREGVSQSDMYFGRFRNLRFFPVKDDLLSINLPAVPQ